MNEPWFSYPEIDPVLFQWGFLVIRWYALAYIFGLLGAWGLARKMSVFSRSTFTVLKIDDFLIWAVFGIIIGGRLGYVIFYNLQYFLEFPVQILMLWKGGMSFHGGLIGVIVATVLFARKKDISLFSMSDILVCVTPIGLFLGRLANFINGELYGRITTSPIGMIFPMGGDFPRHPSQLYEAFSEGILLFLILNTLWWFMPKYRNRTGFLTGLFFVLYAIFRFIIEFFREPDLHLGFVVSNFITMGQILCIPMFLAGLWILYLSSPMQALKKVKE